MLSTALRVLVRCWPALLAWFLLGWTVRALIIRGASYLLNIDDNFGLLLLPLAILAQLAGFVGMFFVIRRELPHVNRYDDPEAGERALTPGARWTETLLAAILPFFLLYVAWNLIRADLVDLYFASTTQDNFFDSNRSDDVSITFVSVALMIGAFVARWLLGRFAARLPRWTSLLATYLEAVWVLVALLTIRDLLAPVPEWFATRRMFAWIVDGWASIRETFAWIGVVGDGIGWVWAQIGTLIGLPLAWLAFAAIIYFGTMPRSRRPEPKAARVASERWARMPGWARRLGAALSSGILDRWRPVALAARLIWRSGPIAMGTYLLAFAVITAAPEWLKLVIYRLIGPHELNWWGGASDIVLLAVTAVLAVVQVCIVAAAFDHALRHDAAERLLDDVGDAVSSAAAPGAKPTTS